MKIGFIGAGRVGTAMGIYLMNNKIQVIGYYSKSFSSANKAALLTNCKAYSNINDLVTDTDTIAITTPDDAIISVVNDLKKGIIDLNNKVIFHMSGVHSSEILFPLSEKQEKNVSILSLHPLLSFSDPIKSANELKAITFTIEGKGEKIATIKELFERLGNGCIEILTENKALYHTACTVLSNYLVTTIDVGLDMLVKAGFSKNEASVLAEPLIIKTVENVIRFDTEKALTGPISRGDIGTMQKHLEILNKNNKKWEKMYNEIGKNTITLAKKAGTIDQDTALRMMEVLENYE